jgi:DNA-binding SARP family transcriptional activator
VEDTLANETAEAKSGFFDPARPIQISVFGSLRIWRSGHEADIGAPRNRIVLAEVLAAAGNVVSVASVVDALWGDNPPASAVNQIHRIVGQLRRTLEPGLSPHASGHAILAEGTGYRIAGDAQSCELHYFRQLVRNGDNSLKRGEIAPARDNYERALEASRGPLFGGLDPGIANRPEFVAIEQERIAVAIAAADLAILHGPSPRTLGMIIPHAASAPFNEQLHARIIRLLATNGRPSEALVVFAGIRQRLADELGVDPGFELSHAYQDILVTDTATAASMRVPRPVVS